MAKMRQAAKVFDPFADATPPRSAAADPDADVTPAPAVTFTPATPPPAAPAAVTDLDQVPSPHEPASDGRELTGGERADLAACEGALDHLRRAFWLAGKALQTIRDGRLYRETHPTFDAYLDERWGMTRQQASRLILSWPLAERLSRIRDKINPDQVQKLLPVADRHGADAAEVVLRVVDEVRDGHVTAAVLREAVKVVPADRWDAEAAAERIRARLSGEDSPAASPAPAPAEQFVTAVGRAWSAIQQTVRGDVVRAAAEQNPGFVRKFASDLRTLADELEKEIPS